MATGLVVMTAPTSSATQPGQDGEHKLWVCHATSSDTNPYVAIHVDEASARFRGHLMHRDDPNKTWKSTVTWNGTEYHDGDAKRDYIEGLDGFTGFPAFCEAPPPPNPKVTAVNPEVEQSTACEEQGTYIIRTTAGVQYLLNGQNIAPGEYDGPATGTITAVASGEAELENPNFSFSLNLPAAQDCPDGPTAVNPTVNQSTQCEVEGTYTIPNTSGVQYRLNGNNIAPGNYNGPASGTITAVASGEAELENPNFSFNLNLPAAQKCPDVDKFVVAGQLGTNDPCGPANIAFVVPADTAELDWTLLESGNVSVAPKAGFKFDQASQLMTFTRPADSGVACPTTVVTTPPAQPVPPVIAGEEEVDTPEVLGVEESRPKPVRKPQAQPVVVRGAQTAAVPTAVDAGFAVMPGVAPSGVAKVGQSLAVGGLGLLMGAAWLMRGRREAGGSEA